MIPSSETTTLGLDCCGETLFVARVTYGPEQPRIIALEKSILSAIPAEIQLSGSRTVLAVPDRYSIAKSVHLPVASEQDLTTVGHFELTQSMLEPEEMFETSLVPTSIDGHYLGILWRRDYRNDLRQLVTGSVPPVKVDYCARAVALGKGYLRFCRMAEEALVTLIDVTARGTSICLLYKQQLLNVTSFPLSLNDLTNAEKLDSYAAELKTHVDFKLSSFHDEELSDLPVSVLMCGYGMDNDRRSKLARHFCAGAAAPVIQRNYFDAAITIDDASPWLAALGLTVN